jgi:hypothetical protein
MEAMDAAERELANALVVMVRGTWPVTSGEQVYRFLFHHHQVEWQQVQICRAGSLDDFLLVFADGQTAGRVLHAEPLRDASSIDFSVVAPTVKGDVFASPFQGPVGHQ